MNDEERATYTIAEGILERFDRYGVEGPANRCAQCTTDLAMLRSEYAQVRTERDRYKEALEAVLRVQPNKGGYLPPVQQLVRQALFHSSCTCCESQPPEAPA